MRSIIIVLALLCFGLNSEVFAQGSSQKKVVIEKLPEGSIFFRTSGVRLIHMTCGGFKIDHSGILLKIHGKMLVFETRGYHKAVLTSPQKYVDWAGKSFHVKIPKKTLTEEMLVKARKKALSLLGKPYDFTFGVSPPSKDHIYCSLAVCMVLESMGIIPDDLKVPVDWLHLNNPILNIYLKKYEISRNKLQHSKTITVRELYLSDSLKPISKTYMVSNNPFIYKSAVPEMLGHKPQERVDKWKKAVGNLTFIKESSDNWISLKYQGGYRLILHTRKHQEEIKLLLK